MTSKLQDTGALTIKNFKCALELCCIMLIHSVFWCCPDFVGGFPWQLAEFIIGVFLQVLGLPFVAVAQVSLFSKVTAEKTQGEKPHHLVETTKCYMLERIWSCCFFLLWIIQAVV